MIEDKLLILRFKQGNNEALRQIYDKYKIQLLKLAVVLIGNRNMAEDIVHDVFVKFAESADRIKLTGSLKNYLVTCVINRVRNYLRDSKRHCENKLEEMDLLLLSERDPYQWENARWEGPPALVVEKITYYESLPDELFGFEIPEGATVIAP